ncbi:MAG: ABC transporter permease [Actinomycetota bacterium]
MVARKEFADHLLSVRFTILMVIMGLAALFAVYTAASQIREVAESSSDFPALFLKLFTVFEEGSRLELPFFELIGLLGPLLGIMFAFDAINGERTQGTLPRLLSQPIYRDDVINGKFVAGLSVIGLILLALVMILSGVGMFRIGITPTWREVGRLAVWLIVTMFYIGFWLALSLLFSVTLRRAATSALAAIAAWLVATLFAGLLIGIAADVVSPMGDPPAPIEELNNKKAELRIARLFPATLYGESSQVLLQPEQRTVGIVFLNQVQGATPGELSLNQSLLVVWPQVTGLMAATVLCFVGAYVMFMKQEVRA